MAKINFNTPLKKLNGEPIVENGIVVTAGVYLANGLVNQRVSDRAMQTYELATKIYQAKDEIEITPSEKDIIVKYLESSDSLIPILARAQILSIVNK